MDKPTEPNRIITVRLPESLHRDLADWALYNHRSVNQQMVEVLGRNLRSWRDRMQKLGK